MDKKRDKNKCRLFIDLWLIQLDKIVSVIKIIIKKDPVGGGDRKFGDVSGIQF